MAIIETPAIAIRIIVGGLAITKPLKAWHALASPAPEAQPVALPESMATLIERKLAGEDTGAAIKARLNSYADDYIGWARYVGEPLTRLTLCDSDADGAFKVYRARSERIDKGQQSEEA